MSGRVHTHHSQRRTVRLPMSWRGGGLQAMSRKAETDSRTERHRHRQAFRQRDRKTKTQKYRHKQNGTTSIPKDRTGNKPNTPEHRAAYQHSDTAPFRGKVVEVVRSPHSQRRVSATRCQQLQCGVKRHMPHPVGVAVQSCLQPQCSWRHFSHAQSSKPSQRRLTQSV